MNPVSILTNWIANAKKGWLSVIVAIIIFVANYPNAISGIALPDVVTFWANKILIWMSIAVLAFGNSDTKGLLDYLKSTFLPKQQ